MNSPSLPRRLLPGALLALALMQGPVPAVAAEGCIAVIGTGSVGGTLGPRFAGAGERVVYGSRDPDDERVASLVARTGNGASALEPPAAAQACNTILLATPWPPLQEMLASFGDLTGRLIIDATNPLYIRGGREHAYEVPGGVAGAEFVQSLAPGAQVVKAFNTVNYRVMAHPSLAGGPVSVPLSGDDPSAKARVAALVSAIGLEPVDVGPLRTARYTEAMALLYVSRLASRARPYEFYLRPHPAD